jgi:hypothetical protein
MTVNQTGVVFFFLGAVSGQGPTKGLITSRGSALILAPSKDWTALSEEKQKPENGIFREIRLGKVCLTCSLV